MNSNEKYARAHTHIQKILHPRMGERKCVCVRARARECSSLHNLNVSACKTNRNTKFKLYAVVLLCNEESEDFCWNVITYKEWDSWCLDTYYDLG